MLKEINDQVQLLGKKRAKLQEALDVGKEDLTWSMVST